MLLDELEGLLVQIFLLIWKCECVDSFYEINVNIQTTFCTSKVVFKIHVHTGCNGLIQQLLFLFGLNL